MNTDSYGFNCSNKNKKNTDIGRIKYGLTSVTLRNFDADKVVELAKSNRMQGIEWGGDVHCPPGETLTAGRIKKLCDKQNISIFSYGSYIFAGESRSLEKEFEKVLGTAILLGAPVIRIWAGKKGPKESDEKYFEKVALQTSLFCDLALGYGIKVAFEYHRNTLTESAESAISLINRIQKSNLALYWQPNPDISFSENQKELTMVSKYLVAVHVFHWTKEGERLPLKIGWIHWKKYLEIIKKTGNCCNLILEFVKDDDPCQLADDAKTLGELIK